VEKADYYGIETGRDTNKFERSGITAVKSDVVDAPYGEEFPVILECNLLNHIEIGLHTQFIGEIMDVKVDPSVLGEDGKPDLTKVDPIIFDTGGRNYFSVGKNIGKAFSIGKNIK
jgi:flavin reductase (DIM6/NTAB) family NADH-FMN oxidoreductase RutF